jgi:hypothetical protein
MTITPENVRKAVSDEDDFSHEMKVAALLAKLPAYDVSHGGTYTDSVTHKPRQYDFRVSIEKDEGRVSLTIECKNLNAQSPLVICGRPREANESFHDLIHSRIGTFETAAGKASGLSSVTLRARDRDSLYPINGFAGKSLLRLKSGSNALCRVSDDDVYDKWSQALSSAVDR